MEKNYHFTPNASVARSKAIRIKSPPTDDHDNSAQPEHYKSQKKTKVHPAEAIHYQTQKNHLNDGPTNHKVKSAH